MCHATAKKPTAGWPAPRPVNTGYGYLGAEQAFLATDYLLIEQQFRSKYPQAEQIPQELHDTYMDYSKQNNDWYTKAEALGWRQWGPEDRQRYLQHFNSMKAKDQGGSLPLHWLSRTTRTALSAGSE